MRIEKLELIGFKSFADKTTFALHPGITGIVGPNGCGKSNIVDAFRWVLGEQSAKSLRGSAQKKQKGMAEVSMVVSGLNGTASSDSGVQSEVVTISRRLYRSGESEYMINKTPCRLKDIKDIFLDTGLDFRSYSILEQGRIGEILNSKPLERRFIIEEVAGVMKYKIRKAEALSKLESSRTNLLRINDIIAEVKKQINILDRLAKKAERYKKLSAEMHAIELKLARNEFQQISDALAVIVEEYNGLREKEAVINAEISEIETKTESRRLVLLSKEKALEAVQKQFQEMEREISEIERAVAVGRNDIANLAEYRTRLTVREEEIDAGTIELKARCDELGSTEERIGSEIEAQTATLREKAEAFRAIEEELAEKEEQIEDKRKEIFRISEHLSGLRNELGRQQSSFEALQRREASSQRESEDARKILAGIETSISQVESGIHGSTSEALLLKEKKDVLATELLSAKGRVEVLTRSLAEAREELASFISRLDSLKEIVFDTPTRELLSAEAGITLLATMSDVIEVDARYERAIEIALAEKSDSLITRSTDDILNAVSSLKGKDVGKTCFITAEPSKVMPYGDPPGQIIGRALDFVKVKEGYERLAENLLGGIVIVKDISDALAMREKDTSYSFVTVDGEVIEPSGAVIVGGEKGIFRRKREIRELQEAIGTKKGVIEEMYQEVQREQSIILEREVSVREAETSLHNIEKEISLSRLTVENYSEERERTSRKLAYLALEIEEIGREKEAVHTTMAAQEAEISQVEGKKAGLENESLLLQEGISQRKSEIEEFRGEVTDLRLLIASNRERLEAVRNEIESSLKAVEDLRQKKEELRVEKESIFTRISQRESEILEYEGRLRKLVAEAETVRLEISQKKEEIERENEDLLSVEQGLKALRQQAAGIVHRISELDVARAEHKLRLENLAANVRNNYGREIGEIEIAEVTAEEQERLVELRLKIQEMGPVNLGTLEEYEELSTRYEFMTKQHEDLTKSIAELEEAISKINSTTRKKLREAYEMLNSKFGEVFTTLFGGGRAELVLTDEHNILESGIEIVAQPPGKKLQNIHLLSGGEKALTALSIQFASFLIKPTPLCILDEADAPLDESNTERYSKMLEDLSSHTQFIVVTHNRTTMGVAQHLYGITMEEAGVSKVISMQLAEVPAA
jgi:chromosome segregation protein